MIEYLFTLCLVKIYFITTDYYNHYYYHNY